ncbi:GMC family oxidoreductase [Streptomyces griseoaurantiacus]|uniref:GMC family oxidoreductase n=1 Tax=Streptomyces griseoaurantiacus TaxID=68213 RepID=UPI0037AA83F3
MSVRSEIPEFDVIVCGAGTGGSTVAGLLAIDPSMRILLVESGPDDEDGRVLSSDRWPENLDSERDWGYLTEPSPSVDGRQLLYSMGKGLGGGSSINVGVWSRGHRKDWEEFSEATDDSRWNYRSALDVYRRLESWKGDHDPDRRGKNGPVHVQPAQSVHPFFEAMLEGSEEVGLDRYRSPNGELAEHGDGCAIRDEIVEHGRRRSPYRALVAPLLSQGNITVLAETLVTKIVFDGSRAVGIEAVHEGKQIAFRAAREVILSLGAVQTPKLLMQPGIGPARHLESVGVDVRCDLPGVGTNLDDHLLVHQVWKASTRELPPPSRAQAVCFWGSNNGSQSPRFVMYSGGTAFMSPEAEKRYGRPDPAFTFLLGMRLSSRGTVRLRSADPTSAPLIKTGFLDNPDDMRDAVVAYRFAESIADSQQMSPYRNPSDQAILNDSDVATYIRTSASTFWHQCGTARMGRDEYSVVDSELRVHDVENLRVADASVLPRVTSGNTMAPCMVVGARAADLVRE